ncbi:MAG: MFS transporter [Rubrivivax sp.]|nr:MFS transporter [Rubrivivax sp.]
MLAVMAAGLAIAVGVGKVPVALPELRDELELTLVQGGWVSSMLTTVAVFGAALVGMWVGRIGALRMALAGLAVCALASLAALLHPGWATLLMSRLFEGLGFVLVAVACPALITAAVAPAQQRFALGLWSTYMPAGASLAMVTAPLLLPHTGWRGLWVLSAVALAGAALVLWLQRAHFASLRPLAPAAAGTSFLAPVRLALGQPLPWLLALGFGVWAVQHFALIVWMPTYLQEQRGLGDGAVAVLTSVMLVACVPGNLIGGWLVQRELPRGLLLAGAQLLTGLGALGYSSDGLPDSLRYALCVGVSFVGGVIPAAVMASSTALACTPQQIGTLQGLYMQGAQLGQFVGTPLIAAVVASSGRWASALWVTASAALLGVALGLMAHRLETRLAGAAALPASP